MNAVARILLAALATAAASWSVATPAVAVAPVYMVCDNPSAPDYPSVISAPRSGHLGLKASVYDLQPVPGHVEPSAVTLRRLSWSGWGSFRATAHGLACRESGRSSDGCRQVLVRVSRPAAILPAGGAVIYQLTRVRYQEGEEDFYQPGVDY